MHSRIISETLPIDQCLAVMDFSQNITLVPQDEIEGACWTQKQVTLHQIFLVSDAVFVLYINSSLTLRVI